jgi:hypothetical protein
MVMVFECPNHDRLVGSAASWSKDGEVQNPDAALLDFFGRLGAGKDLCLRDGSRFYSVKGVTFKCASGPITYIGAESFDDCENHDCCEFEPRSAKFEGK